MALDFVLDPPLTDELRGRVVDLWVRVTNAGGAVGFVPPVTAEDVRPAAEAALADVAEGPDRLLIVTEGTELAGLLFMVDNRFELRRHWQVLKRVMIDPAGQGRGHGAAMMREAIAVGRGLGLEALQVTVRAGAGTENFYARLGFREVGRVPAAIRVAPGDDRDEIYMWLVL